MNPRTAKADETPEEGAAGGKQRRRRLAPEDREHEIVQSAISFFARHGFEGSTRDLAQRLGVSQPLLYRYFPTKEALVDRVYDEVFVRRWNPEWEEWLADRTHSLESRLKRYLKDYAHFVLRGEWVRIFMYAGLSRAGVNQRYLARLRERHFLMIARELRFAYDIPDPENAEAEDEEVELIWAMHSSVFYIGVRKWVYDLAAPRNIDRLIDMRVEAFLHGAPKVLLADRKST
ncbi:TetR/AcrR family transcriptional regulator [Variovorax ginsengisoli]|uniref:TetR/AcrR family transcriptional regulator n=1 Tax=Variovorax ginsengisoli TaxID=363844 RepID=A0ABT8S6M2_9BURK|nr:TetR/AcrR family transcriptional regulator [Variovorax ginsengisoli]MDN8614462.1 TetR/AcrR family transcriptional regulator [Variovorax ginsengisoli]MDO1533632.1 TetR/AcrR family transcriptional regulator [Variovorax ginsengisoli]